MLREYWPVFRIQNPTVRAIPIFSVEVAQGHAKQRAHRHRCGCLPEAFNDCNLGVVHWWESKTSYGIMNHQCRLIVPLCQFNKQCLPLNFNSNDLQDYFVKETNYVWNWNSSCSDRNIRLQVEFEVISTSGYWRLCGTPARIVLVCKILTSFFTWSVFGGPWEFWKPVLLHTKSEVWSNVTWMPNEIGIIFNNETLYFQQKVFWLVNCSKLGCIKNIKIRR